jgi:hypothetical protein
MHLLPVPTRERYSTIEEGEFKDRIGVVGGDNEEEFVFHGLTFLLANL